MKTRILGVGLLGTVFATHSARAQTALSAIEVTENSGAGLTDIQVPVTIDTAALVAASKLKADGGDLRFYADCTTTTAIPYWVESGINTASTKVWLRLPSLPALGKSTVYLAGGNPALSSLSTTDVFDGDKSNPSGNFSGTDAVTGGAAGGAINSQRGYRFAPNQDVLFVGVGKREPNGTTRYVTLFDFATQAILYQGQVSGPAAQWNYANATPRWLTAGTNYLIELYQGSSDGYYFGASSQVSGAINYLDMRYCNSCTQNTFPTGVLTNYHYGTPDFIYRTRKQVKPAPTTASGSCSNTVSCDADCSSAACGDNFVNGAAGETCDDGNFDDNDGCTNKCVVATCGDGVTYKGVEECDDGNKVDTDACTTKCKLAACGDGFIQAGEACDDGNADDNDGCTNKCTVAICGDGIKQNGVEECDDANKIDTDACTNACKNATCGDGITQDGVEQCDDANKVDTDACTTLCKNAACGDGFVQAGEVCDDTNKIDTDGCTSLCKPAKCGDGFVQAGVEECDDSNVDSGDGCSSTCKAELVDAGAKDSGSSKTDAGLGFDSGKDDAGNPIDPTLTGDKAEASSGCDCNATPQNPTDAGGVIAALVLGLSMLRRKKRTAA